jgi:hypothetical protein
MRQGVGGEKTNTGKQPVRHHQPSGGSAGWQSCASHRMNMRYPPGVFLSKKVRSLNIKIYEYPNDSICWV